MEIDHMIFRIQNIITITMFMLIMAIILIFLLIYMYFSCINFHKLGMVNKCN